MQLGRLLLFPGSAIHAPAAVLGKLSAGALSDSLFLSTLWLVQGSLGGTSKETKREINTLCYQLQVYLG